MPPLILFDIDLTLIHTLGAGRKALATAFTRLWDVNDPTAGVSFDGRTDHAIFNEVIALNGLADGDLDGVFARAVEGYLDELPCSIAASESARILPGVVEILDALDERGIRPGLATGNLRRGAAIKLGHFGLWERFPAGGFGDDSPVRADVVQSGLESLAVALKCDPDPARAIIIGDTPLDVEAAHLAGVPALGVATGRYTVEDLLAGGADYALKDLSDSARVLDILLSR
jgi:phosphoglycolate phosphatase-like HAD superfamily hydrolase